MIQEINLSESIAIPNILLIHNTFHEVESGENMTVIFEKYKVPKNLTYKILNSEFKKSFSDLKPGEKFIFKFNGEKLDSITLTKSPRVTYFVENLQNPQVKEVKYKPKFIKEFRELFIDQFPSGSQSSINVKQKHLQFESRECIFLHVLFDTTNNIGFYLCLLWCHL